MFTSKKYVGAHPHVLATGSFFGARGRISQRQSLKLKWLLNAF